MIDEEKIHALDELVRIVVADLNSTKHIDDPDFYSKPDRQEVYDLVTELFGIVYPGYYKDRNIKIYNRQHSVAVTVENVFYHLNKQVTLALDYRKGESLTKEQKERLLDTTNF